MFSTNDFLSAELKKIEYIDFVDQNVTGLAGKMRPMPREIENRIIYHINSNFRRAFFLALSETIDDTFSKFREDNEVRKRVNRIDEFFAENGMGESLNKYYAGKSIRAASFSNWFYETYLNDIQQQIVSISNQLASTTANNLNEIADQDEINNLLLRQSDFGPDGFPLRNSDVQKRQVALLEFLHGKYADLITDKLRDIVDGSGQYFADPVLEALEDLVGMRSGVRERLIRIIERRHDEMLNRTRGALNTARHADAQTSHFEELAVIVTKAIGVSEHLKAELSQEQGGEVQREIGQAKLAADTLLARVEKETEEFSAHVERWAS